MLRKVTSASGPTSSSRKALLPVLLVEHTGRSATRRAVQRPSTAGKDAVSGESISSTTSRKDSAPVEGPEPGHADPSGPSAEKRRKTRRQIVLPAHLSLAGRSPRVHGDVALND